MIEEITKKRWFLHNRQSKVISVAGYAEFLNDIYLSTFPDFQGPRFLTVSGALSKADPRIRDQLEYLLAEHLVKLHNASLEQEIPKSEPMRIVVVDSIPKIEEQPKITEVEGQKKRKPTPKMLAHWASMKGKYPEHLLREKPNVQNQASSSELPSQVTVEQGQPIQVQEGSVQETLQTSPQASKEGGLFQ